MKYDLYDLFTEYDGELPELKASPCDTEKVKQLVLEGVRKKQPVRRIKPKFFIICAAAVLTAVSGLTVTAANGGFSHFRDILSKTKPNPALSDELPLMSSDDVSGMEQNISENRIEFTGSENVRVSTAGMYYDNNTLMLSVEMKPEPGVVIPDDALIMPYFYPVSGSERNELVNQSGIANATHLIKGDEPDTYYATFYIAAQNMSNSRLGVTLKNVITESDTAKIQDLIVNEQARWREEYDFGSHTVAEWKQYWKDNNFDQRTRNKLDEYISECDKVIDGEWSAELNISDISGAAIFSRDGFTVSADTLSLTFDTERELSADETAIPVVTLKDGTVILDAGTSEHKWFAENGIISDDKCGHFANIYADVFSYTEPHPVSSIAEISVYIFSRSGDETTAQRHIIYTSEE